MSEPDIAVALLQLFCRDEALAGDILEEYERRRSRAWLWRQVGVAVIFSLPYGMVRRTRRTPKMQMPIGGLGLIAVIALITIVAPGAWWFMVMGAAGGATLGIALVMASRRKAERQPAAPRHILLSALLVLAASVAARASGPDHHLLRNRVDGCTTTVAAQTVVRSGPHALTE